MDKIVRLVLPACVLGCLVFAVTRCEAQSIDIKREAAGRLQSITNTTVELIGPWIYIARYLIYLMAKEPVTPDFFYDFLEQRTQPTFKNLINQVRIHQPHIYQLFQVILVLTNITAVVSMSILALRSVGTCGASSCQDVTINYRLLFHTYTASALIICGFVMYDTACAFLFLSVGGVFVITCDFRINTGVDLLGIFVHGYRKTLMKFLVSDVLNTSKISFARMVDGLDKHRASLVSSESNVTPRGYGFTASKDVMMKIRLWNGGGSTLFNMTSFESMLNDIVHNQQYAPAVHKTIPGTRLLAAQLDNGSWDMKLGVIHALEDSTLFQRTALMLDITDLINKVRGQLYIFTHEVEKIKVGVENMTSILLTPGKNLLYIPSIQKVVTWSITIFVVFLCLSMGGMMTGFILGYANHDDHASPLDRNKLSNIGGYFLVLDKQQSIANECFRDWMARSTSYCMLFGVTGMLFFSGVFMLLGSIGDLYLCRATRGYERSNVAQLKDLAVSLVMNATVNRYNVLKLLRYSSIENQCVEHAGIAGLAGIHTSAMQTAFDNIVLTQYDLANHFSINIDKLIEGIKNRVTELQRFNASTNDFKLVDNHPQFEKLKLAIKEEIDFGTKVGGDTEGFNKVVHKAFQDYSLIKCDAIKNDLLSYIDMFDNIGNCRKILSVFEESFRILCNGMLDYVNGFWLAMLILVGVFDYAIYNSLVASKYLFSMTTYTYEGEPVSPGTNFEDLLTHRKQKPRRRAGTVTADQRLRQEAAEKFRIMRLKRMSRESDAILKDISPVMIQSPVSMTSEQPTSVQPSSADKSSSVQAGWQPSPAYNAGSKPSQAKPVAVKPPEMRSDELAPEFRR
ncbi:uncharacterized protein LOC119173469 [Rhipicephalus microplus]|uniref:uncharacterized protein LOC119173469 n=1 Tax=Rhipicephalus microplus TaxID=6941 RepID=UPI003F6AC59A